MPIDFNLLNAGALPDFTGGALAANEAEKQRQQQMALAQMQIAAQERMAMPNELDYRKDARAAAMDEIRLAREQRAMGFDANADLRATMGLESDISLKEKQKEAIESDIKLGWNKFKVDTDIAYKDFGLRQDKQSFDKEVKSTELAHNIKWGNAQDDREERKFKFDIQKHYAKLNQEQEFKDRLQAARKQGEESYLNTLLDNGMVNEATVYQDVISKVQDRKFKLETEADKKKYNEAFPPMAVEVLKQGKLSLNNAKAMFRLQNIPVAPGMDENQITEVGTAAFVNMYGNDLVKIGANPGALLSTAIGIKPAEDLADARKQDREKFLVSKNESARNDILIDQNLEGMGKLAEMLPLIAGQYDSGAMSVVADTLSNFETIARKMGYQGKSLQNQDDAKEAFDSLGMSNASLITKSSGIAGDKEGSARVLSQWKDAMNTGPQGIAAFRSGLGLKSNIEQNAMLNALAEKHPNRSAEALSRDAMNMVQAKQQIESKLGRSLSETEFNEFVSEYGD
jgi:hypothetical protein